MHAETFVWSGLEEGLRKLGLALVHRVSIAWEMTLSYRGGDRGAQRTRGFQKPYRLQESDTLHINMHGIALSSLSLEYQIEALKSRDCLKRHFCYRDAFSKKGQSVLHFKLFNPLLPAETHRVYFSEFSLAILGISP